MPDWTDFHISMYEWAHEIAFVNIIRNFLQIERVEKPYSCYIAFEVAYDSKRIKKYILS